MQLRVGMQLVSVVSPASVVIVLVPKADAEFKLCCGGVEMVAAGNVAAEIASPAVDDGSGPILGKRYRHEASGLECLCTRGGAGQLTLDGEPLVLKAAKPLPSSD
jgi:hypothetical protein